MTATARIPVDAVIALVAEMDAADSMARVAGMHMRFDEQARWRRASDALWEQITPELEP